MCRYRIIADIILYYCFRNIPRVPLRFVGKRIIYANAAELGCRPKYTYHAIKRGVGEGKYFRGLDRCFVLGMSGKVDAFRQTRNGQAIPAKFQILPKESRLDIFVYYYTLKKKNYPYFEELRISDTVAYLSGVATR